MMNRQPLSNETPIKTEPTIEPGLASPGDTLVGVGIFLAFGLVLIPGEIPHEWNVPGWLITFYQVLFISMLVIPAIGLGIGWVKRYPRWSYPYVPLALLMGW